MTTQQLHDLIDEKIYENHVGAITATDMNTILNEMVSEEEQIRQTYLPLTGGTITGPLSLRDTLTLPRNIVAIDTDGADELLEIDYTSSPYKVKFGIGYDQLFLRADEIIKYDINWNEYKLLDTGPQIFTNPEKLQVRENIGAVSSSDVDDKINLLDSSITKETSTPVNSSAAGSYKKIAVINGFSLKQTDGKLVDLNALSNPSTVSTVEVDAAGSAQKALSDAKSYSDSLITGLGSVMTFKGVKDTEAEVKALTNQQRGWVWLVRANNSEWVATDDIGSSPNPSKWEKFGDGNISNQVYVEEDADWNAGDIVVPTGNDNAVHTVPVDAIPTENSYNVVSSGGVYSALSDVYQYIDNSKEIFIAEYEVTTEAELIQAYKDNKFIIVKYYSASDSGYNYYFPRIYKTYTSNNTEKFTGRWVYTYGTASTTTSYVASSYIRFRGLNSTGWSKETNWIYGLDESFDVMSQAEVDALFDEGGGGGDTSD